MPKPDVDLISGLNPSISISQKTGGQSPRSTVGTITEIYDYLRVLYARVGTGNCPQCGRPITAQTREQIIARILALSARHPLFAAGAIDSRSEGRISRPVRRPAETGIYPRPGRRAGRPPERRLAARSPDAAHHRGRDRSPGGRSQNPSAAGRGRRVGPASRRRQPCCRRRGGGNQGGSGKEKGEGDSASSVEPEGGRRKAERQMPKARPLLPSPFRLPIFSFPLTTPARIAT